MRSLFPVQLACQRHWLHRAQSCDAPLLPIVVPVYCVACMTWVCPGQVVPAVTAADPRTNTITDGLVVDLERRKVAAVEASTRPPQLRENAVRSGFVGTSCAASCTW